MAFELLSFSLPPFASEEQSPVYVMSTGIDDSQGVRLCDQLFICYAKPAKGKVLSEERISHWIVEASSLAYNSKGLPV